MRRAKRTIVILSLALASCRGPIYSPTATPQTVSVHMIATSATSSLLQELTASYSRPDKLLAVHSVALSWETAYDRLLSGEAPFALTTYLPVGTNLWATPVGQDGLAIIVHTSNPVASLTTENLRRLFQGYITSWAEVGGPEMPVTVVCREEGTDTRLVFQALVMGDRRVTMGARLALSGQNMLEIVASLPGAVGFISMAEITTQVRAVPVVAPDGSAQLPTPDTVSRGVYPFRTPVLIVGLTPPEPGSIYEQWFAWMQSETGQQVIGQHYGQLSTYP